MLESNEVFEDLGLLLFIMNYGNLGELNQNHDRNQRNVLYAGFVI